MEFHRAPDDACSDWFALGAKRANRVRRPAQQLPRAVVGDGGHGSGDRERRLEQPVVLDHFLPAAAPNDEHLSALEVWTLITAAAVLTKRVRLGTLACGVTYRNPALLAKICASVDHISGGRMELGIGAAWFEREPHGLRLGLPHPARALGPPRGGGSAHPPPVHGGGGREGHVRGEALPPGRGAARAGFDAARGPPGRPTSPS